MTIIIDRHTWQFILTSYLYVLSLSCLAVAADISITSSKNHILGNSLALVSLSALFIYHSAYSLMKHDLMISPLFGVWLFYIFIFSESRQSNTRKHQAIRYALMGCAFLLFLFGAALLTD